MRRWILLTVTLAGCGTSTEAPLPENIPLAAVEASSPAPLSAAATTGPAEPTPTGEDEGGSTAVPGFTCLELQPLGPVPAEALQSVERAITDTYRVAVERRPMRPLPKEAYYVPRERYRAEKLLVDLERNKATKCEHVLGITTKDISTTKGKYEDWGILGLGDMPGTAAVISTFRTKKAVKKVPPNERLARVAIHEVGHTLGLPHCPTHGCFLSDAGGTVKTIDVETHLCGVCQGRLAWRGDEPPTR